MGVRGARWLRDLIGDEGTAFMYLAVAAAIVGQALLLSRPILLLYAAIVTAVNATFVRWYEEPTLSRQFGDDYEIYRLAVPGWLPRRRPWDGGRLPS